MECKKVDPKNNFPGVL